MSLHAVPGGVWWSLAIVVLPLAALALRRLIGNSEDQSIASLFEVFRKYRQVDFPAFMKSHREAHKRGQETGDFSSGVCNYYTLMADLITTTSGPYWHFVPMLRGASRKECHLKYHHDLVKYLDAKEGDRVLELGCGFGEMGRQVALISGCSVTGLTMADAEIVGGNERIKAAGLEDRCEMVQGNYHKLPMEANTFDKVFGVYTLKYSSDLDTAISEAARVLKPGGKFLSYEVLVTDKYDKSNPTHRYYVENISECTCMPPLWHAKDFREAARKAGLVPAVEEDLCKVGKGTGPWYSCFTRTGIHQVISSRSLIWAIKSAEGISLLPVGFADWFESCLVHPATDFVNAGRLGIVDGSVMMTWTKPID